MICIEKTNHVIHTLFFYTNHGTHTLLFYTCDHALIEKKNNLLLKLFL
jgi:hypothetical protein